MFAIRVPSGIGHTQQPRETSPDSPEDESPLTGLAGSGKPTLMRTIPTLPNPGERAMACTRPS